MGDNKGVPLWPNRLHQMRQQSFHSRGATDCKASDALRGKMCYVLQYGKTDCITLSTADNGAFILWDNGVKDEFVGTPLAALTLSICILKRHMAAGSIPVTDVKAFVF